MTLREWIVRLEKEESPKSPLQRKMARRLREKIPELAVYSTKADLIPACNYVGDALIVLWADVAFWELLAEKPSPQKICDFARPKTSEVRS